MANEQTIRLTEAQRRAVETVGRDVLVTASAGTGKTAALSRRCAARIADADNPVDADRLLVLTFTDAAAEEMRVRIADVLRTAAQQSRQSRLRQQALLLEAGYISTIHAFCKRTLTDFFYAAGIDPAFAILDADEQRLLKSEVLVETLEAAWREPSLTEAMRVLFAGRQVQPGAGSFVDRIIPLSEFLDSVPGRRDYYQRAYRLNDAADTAYGDLLEAQRAIIVDTLGRLQQQLQYALALDAYYCDGAFISGSIQDDYLPQVETCLTLAQNERLDLLAAHLADLKFRNFPRAPKELDEETKNTIKAPASAVKKRLGELTQFAALNAAYDAQLAGAVALQTQTLLELLRRFDQTYAEAKRRRNVLDFADLEHQTLRLLENNPDVAQTLRRRFEFVFVDEYQDINDVQQRILDDVARGDNLFAVGDIKQSIYGFRQSRPDIFLHRLSKAGDTPTEPDQPLRIDMQDNFRSRRETLDVVNAVFGRIMTERTAQMDYDARAALVARFAYDPFDAKNGGHPVELVILDHDGGDAPEPNDDDASEAPPPVADAAGPEQIDAVQRQAALVARRIRQMVGADGGGAEFQVFDRAANTYRDVRYGDIVILMRSLSFKANTYVQMLRLAQIPVNAQVASGYFEATEISDCLNLLKLLDNPGSDIELAAVLRSPLFGLDDTALAMIRFFADDGDNDRVPFYQAVQRYARDGTDGQLRKALDKALTQLNTWRTAAQRGSLAALLDDIFQKTGLLTFYTALPNGAVRRANLLKLHDRAIQFEQFRTSRPGMGLARFVEFLEKLHDDRQDWAPGQPDSLDNAVRIMSVHKSKGLEFPVVFAAELNTPFNMADQRGQCLIDETTIGLQAVIDGGRFRVNSAAHQVLAEHKRRQTLAEEMRILYVLLTRAREKLILTASRKEKDCRHKLAEAALMGETLDDWLLQQAQCHHDWLLAALADEPTLHRLYATGFENDFKERSLFSAQRIGRDEQDALTHQLLNGARQTRATCQRPRLDAAHASVLTEQFAALETTLTRPYPFEASCRMEAKFSVSALTHRDDEFAPPELSGALEAVPAAVQAKPDSSGGVERRLVGSATHLVFEHLPLDGAVTEAVVAQTIRQLLRRGAVSPAVAAQIDSAGIVAFFTAEPGQAALTAGAQTLREWPFTLGVDAADIGGGAAGETVIVQGIVDMIIPTDDGLIVADFKTDRIDSNATLQTRIERYCRPLAWYARAAADILNQPVASTWLYFADSRKAVAVSSH